MRSNPNLARSPGAPGSREPAPRWPLAVAPGRGAGLRAAALGLAIAIAPATHAAESVWKVHTAFGDESFHTYNIRTFAQDVETDTGGALRLEVQAGDAATSTLKLRDRARSGKLHVAELQLSDLAREDGFLSAFDVPFFAHNYFKSKRLWQVSREAVEKRLHKRGLKALFAVPSLPLGLFSDRPLSSTSDMRGMRIGVLSETGDTLVRRAGATPVRVKRSTLAAALTEQRLNGLLGPSQAGVVGSAWNTMTHLYRAQAWLPTNVVVVNRKAFDRLAPDVRDAVMRASDIAQVRGWNASQTQNDAAVAVLTGHGMQAQRMPTQLKKEFYKIGQRLAVSWTDVGGVDAIRTIEAFYSLQ